jgi:hypothetical protein
MPKTTGEDDMRWLIAPTEQQKGTGEKDFSWTTPGEALVPGSKCSNGYALDDCGCCRAFTGCMSKKATTIGVVADINLTANCQGHTGI